MVTDRVFREYHCKIREYLLAHDEPVEEDSLLALFPTRSPATVRKHVGAFLTLNPEFSERLVSKDSSRKTAVIRSLFYERFDEDTHTIPDPLITMDQLKDAMALHDLSDGNRANFFKDIKRSYDGFNKAWPREVFLKGYTGRQVTGDGRSFEFARLPEGAAEPVQRLYMPLDKGAPEYGGRIFVESLSLSSEERRLVRHDESHIAQLAAKLRVLERFLAAVPSLQLQSIRHVLNNAKLTTAEIDSVYAGTALRNGAHVSAMLTCEVKGLKEDVFEDQLVRQVQEAEALGLECDIIVPLALKAVEPSLFRIILFREFAKKDAAGATTLEAVRSELVELLPALPQAHS